MIFSRLVKNSHRCKSTAFCTRTQGDMALQNTQGMKRKASMDVKCLPAKMSSTLSGIDEASKILDDVIRKIEDANHDVSSADILKYIKSVRGKVGTVAKKIKVGVFGRTGVGKSFLINTILGENLLPSGSEGACTSVIIQVEANSQSPNFIAEIEFISKEVWKEELNTLHRILHQGTKEYDPHEIKSARDKIKAIYGTDGIKKNLEELQSEDIQFFGRKLEKFDTAEALEASIRCYVKSGQSDSTKRYYWPLVKSVTIKVPGYNDILENLVLMDIPGAGDINKNRREMGKKCRRECSTVWIISDVNRATSDESAWNLLTESLKDLVYGGECSSIVYVCTKTDLIKAEEYMRNNDLTDDKLGITKKGQNYEKIKTRKCILHRNGEIRKQIEEEFKEQLENELKDHFTCHDLKVYMVSSAEFKKMSTEDDLLHQKDTEIPKLRALLRSLSRSFPQKREVDYIKEAQGVLSLIQGLTGSDTDVEFSNAFTKLEGVQKAQLKALQSSLRKNYNTLDCCLSEWAKESEKNCLDRAEREVIKPNIQTARGYHKTLRALCEKGGATKSTTTRKVTDLNEVLVSHMREKVDEIFANLFELRRSNSGGLEIQSVVATVERFDVTKEVIPEFKIPVTLILDFIKTQQDKLKAILTDDIIQKKKDIFNCLKETIESAMDTVYTDAASNTGDGSYAKMQDVLRKGINTYKSTMFIEAKENSLKRFKDLIDHIEETLRELENIANSALCQKHTIHVPDISEEVEKMKELRKKVENQQCM